ncbi:MAG: hypothetical protein ACI9OO_000250 [Bacteroidia bacterium]|jgi:hypothetical protein
MNLCLRALLLGLTALALSGCPGDTDGDPVAVAESPSLTPQAAAANVNGVAFVSATPHLIGLKGFGSIPEQSTVIFNATNTAGEPVQDLVVDFELRPTTGGVTLSNAQGTTGADGNVQTIVNSGEIPTTVRVRATATQDGATTSVHSRDLVISTGIATQGGLSISAKSLNIEGWDTNGAATEITVLAADRYNHPVADDTVINFIAEGGLLEPYCFTKGGACSVIFTAREPRPSNGRVAVLATAIGEESFDDDNPANGRFDDSENFVDLPEAFLDKNENDDRGADEYFYDDNSDDSYSHADTLFNGLLCNGPRCGTDTLTVSKQVVIVLSGSNLEVTPSWPYIHLHINAPFVYPNPDQHDADRGIVRFEVQDVNHQPPPEGTKITFTTTQGNITSGASTTVPSTNAPGPITITVTVDSDGNQNADGTLTMTAETPQGVKTTHSILVSQRN